MRYIFFLGLIALCACGDESAAPMQSDLKDIPYNPQSYMIEVRPGYPPVEIPGDNPLTVEGISLGRKLFYDEILSRDNTISCASCHLPAGAFTDNKPLSPGIDGQVGRRSAMSLLDMTFAHNGLFWDGRAQTLEDQALIPVEDPLEMGDTWENVIQKISGDPQYPALFRRAFGIESKSDITRDLVAKAIAQFERTLVSTGMSKYDRVVYGSEVFTDEELQGFEMFFDLNPELPDAECGHCHNAPLFTTHDYFNNGLDEVPSLDEFEDIGLGAITGKRIDNGKFRVPTLRNIEFSAPYMHDGRFQTLREVIDHYNAGGKPSPNKDELIRPLGLTEPQVQSLLAFIRTLRDEEFIVHPQFQDPDS